MIVKKVDTPNTQIYFVIDDLLLSDKFIMTDSLRIARKIDKLAKEFPTFDNFYEKYQETLDKIEFVPKSFKDPQRYALVLIERELRKK